ncbi:HAD family hydrolase [Nanoarchaeota archaeon]
MTQNYIFDLFRTLVTEPGFRTLFRDLFKMEYDEIRKHTTVADFGGIENCVDHVVEAYRLGFNREKKEKIVKTIKEWQHTPQLYPGVLETLTDLKGRGAKIGLISNCDDMIYGVFDKTELSTFFDACIFSHKEGVSKPDPTIYHICLDQMKASPLNTTMVGDRMDNDVAPAREMGMRGVLIDYSYKKKPSDSSEPDRIISLKELLVQE